MVYDLTNCNRHPFGTFGVCISMYTQMNIHLTRVAWSDQNIDE